MSDFGLKNFLHILWSVIVGLNLFLLLLIYRAASIYRAERKRRLEATLALQNNVRQLAEASKNLGESDTFLSSVDDDSHSEQPATPGALIPWKGRNPREYLKRKHMLYICDSEGDISFSVPFLESDYLEAMETLDNDETIALQKEQKLMRSIRRKPSKRQTAATR